MCQKVSGYYSGLLGIVLVLIQVLKQLQVMLVYGSNGLGISTIVKEIQVYIPDVATTQIKDYRIFRC